MAWEIVDLSRYEGAVSVERGGIMVRGQRIPLDQVDTLLLGPKVKFGHGLMHHSNKFDVSVVFCDWKSEPVGAFYSWSKNTRVGTRHRLQARLSEPRRKNAWKQIVKAKVQSQSRTLELAGRQAEANDLAVLGKNVRSGDPANVEAQAARIFWSSLYGNDGFVRIPGAQDGINAMHNYGYTILRGRVLRAVVAAGLNPSLGIFHRGRSNAFCLVDDLIEPFRAIVDRSILQIPTLEEATLNAETKRHLVASIYPEETLDDGFRPPSRIDLLTSNFARYVEGELDKLSVPRV